MKIIDTRRLTMNAYRELLIQRGATLWYIPDPDWIRVTVSYLRDRRLFSTVAEDNLATYLNTLMRAEHHLLNDLPPAYRSRGVWLTFGKKPTPTTRTIHQTTGDRCSCANHYRIRLPTTGESMCYHIQQVRIMELSVAWRSVYER